MELLISPNHKIKNIQDEFQKRFPFLKLEFFEPGKPISPNTKIDSSKLIGSLNASAKSHDLKITGLMTVKEVEKMFSEAFRVNVQVFRQSGKVWLNTSATDDWTLAEQNHEAGESNKTINEKPEKTDYHEQE